MTGDEMQDRRLFGEKDVSRILKRAAEIQGEEGETEPHGLSLAELQQVAREVGIAPEAVTAAVAELQAPERTGFHLHGGPTSFSQERVVAGEVSDETWEAMLDEIRRTYRMVGVSGRVGQSLEWTHNGRHSQTQVAVAARDDRVRIRIAEHYPRQAAIFFAPVMALIVGMLPAVLAAAGLPSTLSLGLAFGLFGVVFLLLRVAFGSFVRRKERKARTLLHRLERIAAAPAPAPAADVEADVEADVPLLDLAPDAEPASRPPTRTRRSR